MTDRQPPDAPPSPLGDAETLGDVWARFRGGAMVMCPSDGGPLALAVDAAAGAYRFVCTPCGLASPWFESSANAVHVRGTQPGAADGPGDEG